MGEGTCVCFSLSEDLGVYALGVILEVMVQVHGGGIEVL